MHLLLRNGCKNLGELLEHTETPIQIQSCALKWSPSLCEIAFSQTVSKKSYTASKLVEYVLLWKSCSSFSSKSSYIVDSRVSYVKNELKLQVILFTVHKTY